MEFNIPTKIIAGEGCVVANAKQLGLGKRCLIVTGHSSAVRSGALSDVRQALDSIGAGYAVYDRIGENPLLSACAEGARLARDTGAEFVVGIGGGSPLDASKAIAALAANDMPDPMGLWDANVNVNPPLPVVAIPTTAGTGSEANAYSVLTLDGRDVKKTYSSPNTFPRLAFLDARYTASLPERSTMSCAMDAACHCLESYLSPKSTVFGEVYALRGIELIAPALWSMADFGGEDDFAAYIAPQREALLTGASMAGIAISITGTGFPHPMGYNPTLYCGVPHGLACGMFTEAYIEYCGAAGGATGERLARFMRSAGMSAGEYAALFNRLLARADIRLSRGDVRLDEWVTNAGGASNFANCFAPYDTAGIRGLYETVCERYMTL